ncbi:MAG: hypothetical protein Q8N30_00800 [Methylococcales bacterium]|nr:hypothetical protein [Methylococcales bacterium]
MNLPNPPENNCHLIADAQQLNECCHCLAIDKDSLRADLFQQQGDDRLYQMLIEERPHLFTDVAVFVNEATIQQQRHLITAIEKVVALPAYQRTVLAYAPRSAAFIPKARGVFLGYDFHLTPNSSQLIEINTNAGGALLNALLISSQKTLHPALATHTLDNPESAFIAMFQTEWQLERGQQPLKSIAIVDEHPDTQFLLPEFMLFQTLFARHGIKAIICDPSELVYRDNAVWHGDMEINLIYNRLTDFGLEAPAHYALCAAYLANAVVVTPHPRAHALYADKRNLALLSNKTLLQELGVDNDTINTLIDGIAPTVYVDAHDAEALWLRRKKLFFKPSKGYGSKAVYRGDKLTKRVFEDILQGDYVAQTLVPPSERHLSLDNQEVTLKLDLRLYTYGKQILLASSRLYQGQTTNFRTIGGGFARVVIITDEEHYE